MTDAELFGTFFGFDRDENGWPKLPDPGGHKPAPTAEQLYREYLRLNGVTDRAKQDRLWAAERGRRRDRSAAGKVAGRRPRTPPPGGQRQHDRGPEPEPGG